MGQEAIAETNGVSANDSGTLCNRGSMDGAGQSHQPFPEAFKEIPLW